MRPSTFIGLLHKEDLQFLIPNLNLDCLRLSENKVADKLIEIVEFATTRVFKKLKVKRIFVRYGH